MLWIVGDVHGCVRELDDLIGAIRLDPSRDTAWCAGDLVNTGPESPETLRLWRDLGGRTVLGNHDAYALLARSGSVARRKDRLESLFRADDADALLDVLREAPASALFRRGGRARDVRLLHAGVSPAWRGVDEVATRLDALPRDDARLQDPDMRFLTRVRCCDRSGDMLSFTGRPEDAPAPYAPWDAFYRGEELVVHGHWARRGFYRGDRTMGLDSGCVYGGRLTAWCLEEDRVESIPCRTPLGYRNG